MTGKECINSVAKGKSDIIQTLLNTLAETESDFCLMGALAVNAYGEPVGSLDLDIVATVRDVEAVARVAEKRGSTVEHFQHSVNLSSEASNFRIQIKTDPRSQEFIPRAQQGTS